MYIYTHIDTWIQIHIYIHTYIHTYMYAHKEKISKFYLFTNRCTSELSLKQY